MSMCLDVDGSSDTGTMEVALLEIRRGAGLSAPRVGEKMDDKEKGAGRCRDF
jgi:hypothetical protein